MAAGPASREILLDVSTALNRNISDLSGRLAAGPVDPEALRRIRQEAVEGQRRLDDLGRRAAADPGIATDAARVRDHLDLMVEVADACDAAPSLARKLLDHLLEEQIEITREISASGPPAPGPGPDGRLPGNRRPLTVGSLIGR